MKTLRMDRRINALVLVALLFTSTSALAAPTDPEQAGSQHQHTLATPPSATSSPIAEQLLGEPQITRYVCPMHPNIVRDQEGTCPICGMDLEPMSVSASNDISVQVGGALQQALGVRMADAERRTLWRYLETVGSIEYDETRLAHVHPRASGWIEKLHVTTEGQPVKQGQLLYEIYSPELVVAQDDFRSVLKTIGSLPDARGKRLRQDARTRLKLLGIDERVIRRVEQQDRTFHVVPYYAPKSGFVSKLMVRDGMYVEPITELFTLVNLDQVWLIADVFETQQRWFEVGRQVELDLPSVGIRAMESTIDYIYPELDPITRSLKVRMVLTNPDGVLRPGMIADLRLYGGPRPDVLTIPAEALIVTGQSNRVIVKHGEHFHQREVSVGMMAQGYAEILEGLQPGEQVVISGQFLLDSEANLKASLTRLGGGEGSSDDPSNVNTADPHAGHQH